MNRFLYVGSIDDLTQAATVIACNTLKADGAILYLLDEVHERLVDPRSGGFLLLEGKGFAPWSVFHRQTLLVSSAADDERRHPAQNGFAVSAATPLLSEGRIVGALEVNRTQPHPFSAEDQVQLEALAQEIATGLVAVQLRDDLNSVLLHTGEWMGAAQEAVAPGGRGHVWRVSQLCAELAQALAFSAEDRQRIWLAAEYHDIGWVVGAELDALTLKRTHPVVGARALRSVRVLEPIADLVELHHERFDGSGYPQGLSGGAVSLEACILSLAEDFDEVASTHKNQTGFSSPADLLDFVHNYVHVQGVSHHPRVVAALESLAGQGKMRVLYF